MKPALLLTLLAVVMAGLLADEPEYASLKQQAEKYYAEGSYALAHEQYLKAHQLKLSGEASLWVEFRLADTQWRSQAASQTADNSKYEESRKALEQLIRGFEDGGEKDVLWAEVQESLGDFWWLRRDSRNWGQGWQHYQQALDWWAGSDQIDTARTRYLSMLWKMSEPRYVEPYYYYGYYGNWIPLNILDNALKIAKSENDQARAHYLIAMTLRYQGGDYRQQKRVPDEFEAALKIGKGSDWYDDALFHYAQWLEQNGRIILRENNQWTREPDFVRAVQLYRQLISEFQKGESQYFDQAKQQMENITRPTVGANVSNIFLPDSEIQFYANWRNVKRIEFSIYRVHLLKDIRIPDNSNFQDWIQKMPLAGREKVRSWTKETDDQGDHKPGQESIRVEGKLAPGAYIVEAQGAQPAARDLILVTDSTLVTKTSGTQALIYFCDAIHGSPIANASVRLWKYIYRSNKWIWESNDGTTNGDGIALFQLGSEDHNQILAVAASGERQAFSAGYSNRYYGQQEKWRIYAFTDRPAYRPNEEVQWKFVARTYDGSVYSTPSNQVVEMEIQDPRGTKVHEAKVTLNDFGSAWGTLKLTESMPLGEYQITFWDAGRSNTIGRATLFRLEEYKLPEFKVAVQLPEEDGNKKIFRVGDPVEVNIQADYYFGGPVSNADVEVLVYQNPFYHWWYPPHEYSWYYEDMNRNPYQYWYGGGQIIKQEKLKTDATGQVSLTFDTPANANQDFQYRIEARVTDASRREITGSDMVRVTRQSYYIYPRPKHYLYKPQDQVTINLKALDANNNPVQAEGAVTITRDYWFEIWISPDGKEISGKELDSARRRIGIFPPQPEPGHQPWKLKFRGYQHDEILTHTVKTNKEGEAELKFTPEREGYYRAAWNSKEKDGAPIQAETTVWVATNATTELGYQHGGLQIIVDKDTFRSGQTAPVLLSAPANDRYVLFSVEGDDLYSYQLVHMTGSVKLVELPIEEKHVPNIFLSGALVTDRQLFVDTKQVVVPPEEHFLQVEVQPDRAQYQPQEEGTLKVTTRDSSGKPVPAELSLAIVDESVYYIQQDYAGDPRQFYFGSKRSQTVQTQSTFQQKSYASLVERDKKLVDKDQVMVGDKREDLKSLGYITGGKAGVDEMSDMAMSEGESLATYSQAAGREVARNSVAAKTVAAPAPPAEPMSSEVVAEEPVQVRSDFRSTVLWKPDVITGEDGTATVKLKYPDSLTSWKAQARVLTRGSQFGIAEATTRTKKPLIVRLQAPRFFVVNDLTTVSAVINNNTDEALTVSSVLKAEGLTISGLLVDGRQVKEEQSPVNVAPNSEGRVDWLVSVKNAGTAKLTVTARGGRYADAMEKTYPVFEHGIEKFIARSGKVRGEEVTVLLNIPKERKAGTTSLAVQVTPSMAVTMLDALPYLIDYPYGCTEQTMSRFLPSVITAKTMKDLGLEPNDVFDFGGIEKEHAEKTHPKGRKKLGDLDAMVKAGLDRLYDFQHSDGGWGWWKEGESDHFMTAYVVWGMTLAKDAGVSIQQNALNRGVNFLQKELVEQENYYDMQAWMLHALANHGSVQRRSSTEFERKALENLWKNRDRLNAYTRALLALSAHYYGDREKAETLIRNLQNGVKKDTAPDTSVLIKGQESSGESVIGTAHWGEDGIYWRWSDGGVEATAFALRALMAIDPGNELVEPVTNWLVRNRRGAQWNSTRDTAIVVLTLNDYLRKSGELSSDLEYEISVNGQPIADQKVGVADILRAPSRFDVPADRITDGKNEIRIRRKSGDGPIYFAAEARYFSLEEPIPAAGNEIFVKREYYRLVGKPTLLKGYVYEKKLLQSGEELKSGDRVETVITIEAKNNYEYLVFEDLKPAGLEAVAVRSGEPIYAQRTKAAETSSNSRIGYPNFDSRWVYQELRDRKVALFIDKLPEGLWQIRYEMRAEVPGTFHALPTVGHAMYVPEIRANSDEQIVQITD